MSADNYLAIRRAKTVGKPELGAYWAILDGNVSTGHETLRDGRYKTRDDAIDAAQEILEREVIEYGISVIERVKINITVPEDQQDTPGDLFDTRMDANGNTLREADGRIHLYER